MKKYLVSLAAAAAVIINAAASPAFSAGIYPDVNDDGSVDVFDMITARKCLLKEETIADLYSMDMDFSGDISVADIVMLEKYLLGR